MNRRTAWWKEQTRFKENKAVVKLYNDDSSFLASINIPSCYWPLNGPYEAFHTDNTCFISKEDNLYSIVNATPYLIGYCYTNTESLLKALHAAGFTSAVPYCGWAFIGESIPIHHCWAVLSDETGKKAVLDLSCDWYQMHLWLNEQADKGIVFNSGRDAIVAWTAHSKSNSLNTDRCFPLGKLPPSYLYIGCPCDPQSGILLYHKLLRDYPGHLCERTVNSDGYNPTQWKLKQEGLMP